MAAQSTASGGSTATTSADKGLGTGVDDYHFNVDAFKGYGRYVLFSGVDYAVLGSSQYIRLNNVFNANLGASYRLDPVEHAGFIYFAQQRPSSTGYPQSDLTAFMTHKMTAPGRRRGTFSRGLPTAALTGRSVPTRRMLFEHANSKGEYEP